MRRPGLTAMIILAAVLYGCATPRYQTVYRYEAPVDTQGRACLGDCQARLAACQDSCSQAYQACIKSIEPLVDARYAQALERYAQELDRYAWDLRHYEMQLWLGWGRGPWYYDPWPYYAWPGPYWYPYPPPSRPSREAVQAQLRRERCVEDCGCLSQYDTCFLACGGRKIPEERCVANCPGKD